MMDFRSDTYNTYVPFCASSLKQRTNSHPERKTSRSSRIMAGGSWTQRALSVFQGSTPVQIGFCPNGNSLGWVFSQRQCGVQYTASCRAYSALSHWLSLVLCRLPWLVVADQLYAARCMVYL